MAYPLSRRAFAAGAALLPFAPGMARAAAPSEPGPVNPTKAQPVNPLVRNRADAQIMRVDGWYYMTGSVPEYDRLVLRRARTLAGLTDAPERVLWHHQASGPLSGFIWAPELHRVDGRWVMYFAAGPSGGGADVFRIRTWAVACEGPDPMTGNWQVLGQFNTPWDSFNLDSTSFVHRGRRWFCWAQREPGIETNSNLYLAPMAGALRLAAAPVRLSVPELPWEIQGYKVNEAPAFLAHGGRVFITYSASATDARYCLGMVHARADADLSSPASWTKSPVPVFTTCAETGVYGPGHNAFTTDLDGAPMLVYHGRDYAEIKGDPLFDPNRHTRVQKLYFGADGMPDFGVPVGNGPLPDRFGAMGGGWLAHDGTALRVGAGPLPQSQFRSLDAGDGTVRIAPILLRDHAIAVGGDGTAALTLGEGSRFRRVPAGGRRIRLQPTDRPGWALAAGPDGRVTLARAGHPGTLWQLA